MTKASYIFWDADNTLTANGDLHWRKHLEVAKRHGVTIDPQYQKRIYHNNGSQNWVWLTTELGLKVGCTEYLKEIDTWYADHMNEIECRPGVIEALDMFKRAGIKQCVVSNGRRNSVMLALEAKDLVKNFEFVMCKEDYEGRKPDPAPYIAALRKMEEQVGRVIDPSLCLAVEDDPLGVTSAHDAGMKVIHRRVNKADPSSPEADASAFEKEQFLEVLRRFA